MTSSEKVAVRTGVKILQRVKSIIIIVIVINDKKICGPLKVSSSKEFLVISVSGARILNNPWVWCSNNFSTHEKWQNLT